MRRHGKKSSADTEQRGQRSARHIVRGAFATRGGSVDSDGRRAPGLSRAALPATAFAALLGALVLATALAVAAAPAVTTGSATNVGETSATLNGTVNPEEEVISQCFFEYGKTASYGQTASCEESSGEIGEGTAPVPVHADLSGLDLGAEYHYRLVAENEAEEVSKGSDQTFKLESPPVIAAQWATDVVFEEAKVHAEINPEGEPTTYHLEYGPTAGYGSETEEKPVGSDSEAHVVTENLAGLDAGSEYHYRFVATNSIGTIEGEDHVFRTYAPEPNDIDCPNQDRRNGASAALPDCRAYEMVSPVDKNNGDIRTLCNINCRRTALNQAAVSGNRLTYSSYKAFGDAIGSQYSNQYIATRGSTGWTSHGITPLKEGYIFESRPFHPFWDLEVQFKAFDNNLSTAWLTNDADPPLTADAVDGRVNLYRRANATDGLTAITTGEPPLNGEDLGYDMVVEDATPSGDLMVFSADTQLTPNAASGGHRQLYGSTEDGLGLISVLPNGEAATADSFLGGPASFGNSTGREGNVGRALSSDGSRIYWTYTGGGFGSGDGRIYLRQNGTETLPVSETVSEDAAFFWTAAVDGSRAIFSIDKALYSFDVATGEPTLISDDVYGVMGASDDGTKVYFVSGEALDEGATKGERNLYVDDEGTKTYIATLSPGDTGEGQSVGIVAVNVIARSPFNRASRVSADGDTVAFESINSLTGYDNTDTVNGEPNLEVYLYKADAGRLICVSCRPSGARPNGQPLQEPFRANDSPANNNGGEARRWAAAWIPTAERQMYFPRTLSEDGKYLFFNAFDALLPQDTNGKQDVYEWRAEGVTGCERSDGCISLISSGESPLNSEFVDASPDGRDVFFSTSSSLVPEDPGLIDIYDARAAGGFDPPPTPPAPCVGDACQSIPPAPRTTTPSSSNFRGDGNVRPSVKRRQCAPHARRARKLRRIAVRFRIRARRVGSARGTRLMRVRARRISRRAIRFNQAAKRCRRINQRVIR